MTRYENSLNVLKFLGCVASTAFMDRTPLIPTYINRLMIENCFIVFSGSNDYFRIKLEFEFLSFH